MTTGFSLQIPESNRRFFVGLVLLLVVKVSSVCTVLYQWCYKAAPVLHVLYDSHDTKGHTVQTQNVECTEHQKNLLRTAHQTVFKIDNPPHDNTRKCGRELIQLSQKTRCHPTFSYLGILLTYGLWGLTVLYSGGEMPGRQARSRIGKYKCSTVK